MITLTNHHEAFNLFIGFVENYDPDYPISNYEDVVMMCDMFNSTVMRNFRSQYIDEVHRQRAETSRWIQQCILCDMLDYYERLFDSQYVSLTNLYLFAIEGLEMPFDGFIKLIDDTGYILVQSEEP